MKSAAVISPDGLYRYQLTRQWDESLRVVCFVCLNPSTADAEADDPTVRRLVGYAQDWGYGGLILVNLFAWRATKPAELYRQVDPVGPENDQHIQLAAMTADKVVAAWGAYGNHMDRARAVAALLAPWQPEALAVNTDGSPGHPLYLKKTLFPKPWSAPL